ncbi:peptidase T [Clostridium algidicarnis]|uniref:Peptidase T n=2 Tax=Clostridium algidicarnis TaxID=37659 RepID=A0A2S6FUQ5_9CLOT|nr:peptidase T [Clostridium algidicarnis]MBB6698447.1 peptidase T [Clostridium algidicarnis]MBU3197335.1 peptidase T [Clostridium algidicarnis]MBU3220856.1 peptidase T [Clostridium algidicarnis]PPK43922.1 tripeptide aminopeptidase [Clostridium algidicarnis DSM 15099]
MSKVVEKFLKYVKFETKSDETTGKTPSTEGQIILAKELCKELQLMGMKEPSVDDNGYVMATLPSNLNKVVPTIGFIAHMDTSPDMSGKSVKPQIIEDYKGGDIILNKDLNIILSKKDFPEIENYIGKTLITTDGTTLLGADDKAGIAEIMAAMEYLIDHPEIKHGEIKLGFTPDEEIGEGADHFDVERFAADFAYTIDGGKIGELEYENFNAAGVKVVINGRNIHPGNAYGKMINSITIASEFMAMLPSNEVPEKTKGYEGFYLLTNITGEVEKTTLSYIIRDFDKDNFEKRKENIKSIGKTINDKYGMDIIEVKVKDQYYNMKEKIEPVKHVVDIAFKAMEQVGVTPIVIPIRGGTDGARLSYMGLPTPNIFAGGENFHGKYEFICKESMEKAVEVIIKIVELYSEK